MSDGTFSRTPRPYVARATDARDRDPRSPDRQAAERQADDGASGDPLAELARLIGQSDPFAPVAPRAAAVERHSEPGPVASRDNPDRYDERAQDRGRLDQVRADPGQREWQRATQPASHFPVRPAPTDSGAEAAYRAGHPDDDHHHESAAYAQLDDEVTVAVDHVAEAEHDADADYAEEYAEADGYEHDEYAYENEPEENHDSAAALKRRNGAKLAIAVLGLAVFGTAAAFGYRAVFKGSVTGPPPVIRAEAAPTKVFPADANAKPISERLNEGGAERVVRRDEDPVDLRTQARGGNTGAIMPGTGAPVSVAPPTAFAPQSVASPASPPTLTEPKRVRTVTIRADQPNAPDRGIVPPPPRTSAPASRPASPTAPLPLNPQAVATAEPPPPAAVRQPAPVPRAAESGGNGYVVQLSAQKSEAEAQASLRAAQAKYSALSGQPPLIRRKDQGERGIFYAAQVGPFGSRDEATQLCESLKSAGGNCFVAKN
jgi:SPOR domain